MTDFVLESDAIALPPGAYAKTHRQRLRYRGRTLLALTQGDLRSYVFPLMTPAGFCVTAEAAADHPHHSGFWIASDHVHAMMPAAHGTVEEYTYNFYVNETFQGRAPGRILTQTVEGSETGEGGFRIVEQLEWRGPREWAAEAGRIVARETRSISVTPGERAHRIDIVSTLGSGDHAMRLGPTRHAWFNLRVADSMIVANGGVARDDRGRTGGESICGPGARWVDFTGPVGGGALAGATVIPRFPGGREPFWFVADWGVITVGPFREKGLDLEAGQSFETSVTILVHDGLPDLDAIEAAARQGRVT